MKTPPDSLVVGAVPPVASEVRRGTAPDGSEQVLRVDPVALEALEAARAAGSGDMNTPGRGLPAPEELPLIVAGLEARLETLESTVKRAQRVILALETEVELIRNGPAR